MCALAGSLAGAWSVTQIDPAFIRKLMPFILLVVLIYTLAKKDLGANHKPHTNKNRERLIACLIGAVIGWYDGCPPAGPPGRPRHRELTDVRSQRRQPARAGALDFPPSNG